MPPDSTMNDDPKPILHRYTAGNGAVTILVHDDAEMVYAYDDQHVAITINQAGRWAASFVPDKLRIR